MLLPQLCCTWCQNFQKKYSSNFKQIVFSFVRLAEILKNMFIAFNGTITSYRTEKALLPDVKEIAKQPRGTFASCRDQNAKVLVVSWKE